MFFTPLILAAGSLPTLISGAPIPSILSRRDTNTPFLITRDSASSYTVFGGNGEISDGWPGVDQWEPFDQMFQDNMGIMQNSCQQWGVPNNSETEIADLKQVIAEVGEQTGVDPRFIFAIVMQESNGCVRVPTTDNGVTNPGLMQSHDGSGSCNQDSDVQNPCPKSEISQMIHDGTAGTTSGAGLKQCLEQATGSGATKYYQAARIYNSGSLAASGNLGQGGATACYVSDLTNRLLGWSSGTTGCDAGTIGSLTGSSGGSSTGSSPSSTSTPVPSPTETDPGTSPAETPSPTATTPDTSTGSSAPAASVYPYAASPCQKYYTIQSGDYCDKVATEIGITFSQLRQWNSGLDAECSNLWLGYQYCVSA